MRRFAVKILYGVLYLIWFLFSLLPLWLLYRISDILYFPCYYLIRYRRKIVRKNLVESFPDKSLEEIVDIEKKFYCYFCDYMVETIKLFSMSKKQMRKRMTFTGIEMVDKILETRDCVLYLGHYCNWEWVCSIPMHLSHSADSVVNGQIYHKLENEAFDKLFLRMRSRFHGVNIEMFSALRHIVKLKRENKKYITGFISDQSPNWDFINQWTDFLHHKTAFFVGAESIGKSTDAVFLYLDMERVKRGYYNAEFVLMTDSPKSYPNYHITEDYARRLEQTIRRAPQYWLWSHNRWKRTYEEYLRRKGNQV